MARRNSRGEQIQSVVNEHVDALVKALQNVMRRTLAEEITEYFAGANGARAQPRRAVSRRKRPAGCIAPGCKNPGKGPRYHYLCEKHKDASKKEYQAWREAKRAG